VNTEPSSPLATTTMKKNLSWGWDKLFSKKPTLGKTNKIENSENPNSVIINITVNGDLKIEQK
jgi:hypothetical protein